MADSTSPLDLIASDQAQKEVTANAALNALSPAALYGLRAASTSLLTFGYHGGRLASALIANGTVALTASATNYIVAHRTTGAVTASTGTTNWNDSTNYLRLYLVVTNTTGPTSWEDHRQAIGGAGAGGGATTFAALTDTPANYTGASAQLVRVKTDESGLEFITPPAGTGDVVGPASSVDNTLPRFDGTSGKALQGSGVAVTDLNEISGYRGHVNPQTGTTYTLVAADSGKVVELENAAAIAATLPDSLPAGFCCTVVQAGAGQVTFGIGGGATLRQRQSHTKTAGQWAGTTLYVRTNAGGSAAEWVLMGDTAA